MRGLVGTSAFIESSSPNPMARTINRALGLPVSAAERQFLVRMSGQTKSSPIDRQLIRHIIKKREPNNGR